MLRRNVLIFHAGALGDFVLSWPLAMAIGRLYPQSRVICVCAAQKGKLLERALRLESVDVENGFSSLFAESAQLPENVRKLLDGAHTICSFVAGENSTWGRNVAALAPNAVRLFIDPTLPPDFTEHASKHLLNQLQSSPVIAVAVEQLLRSIAERGLGVTPNPTGPIIIHPGAGSPAKCWSMECFDELATKLRSAGKTVSMIAGEVEIERWPATTIEKLQRPATLVALFDLLRTASAFIGNDSGPSHLAGILGIPTIALFGPTDPAVWHPLGPSVKIISRPRLDGITVDEVFAQL